MIFARKVGWKKARVILAEEKAMIRKENDQGLPQGLSHHHTPMLTIGRAIGVWGGGTPKRDSNPSTDKKVRGTGG